MLLMSSANIHAGAVVIANPAARKSSARKVERALRLLREGGCGVKGVFFTERAGHAVELARRAALEGASLVIAAGGDGTFNEVMNGLISASRGDTPMAILPTGTTNVLAKELGIPEDIKGATGRVLSGGPREVFLGRVTFADGGQRRLFFQMAGVGFDAEAVLHVNKALKRYWGKGAYILSGLALALRWRPVPIAVRVDGALYTASSLIVCNGAKYGGHMKAAPGASLFAPRLYAVLMRGLKKRDVPRYALGVLTGRHTGFGDVSVVECRKEVEVMGRAHLQTDGDYAGTSPAIIDIAPERLKIIC